MADGYVYYTVIASDGVNIRISPSRYAASMGAMSNGTVFRGKSDTGGDVTTDSEGYQWVQRYTDGYWACYSPPGTGDYMTWTYSLTEIKTSGTTTVTSTSQTTTATTIDDTITAADEATGVTSTGYTPSLTGMESIVSTMWNTDEDMAETFSTIRSILGVIGLPYQFLPHVDPRVFTTEDDAYSHYMQGDPYGTTLGIGAMYAEEIVSSMPILFMTPGYPNFMGDYTEEEKNSILQWMTDQAVGALSGEESLEDLIQSTGKYYTFESDVAGYYMYVNPMCRIAAALLEVCDITLDSVRLDMFDWSSYTLAYMSGVLGGSSTWSELLSIPFYIESETQVSDSFGNQTSESSLASTVDGYSDLAREAAFILGNASAASNFDSLISTDLVSSIQESFTDLLTSGNDGILGNLTNHLVSIATGGKMIFPKIWSGSDFSRSYDVTIKLRSPDMNNLSLFLNIIVPTMHCLGFVAPHMISTDPNSYSTPFLVRAIYKGFFNVDMGLITNMNITKGDTAAWTANGVPAQVDISFSIVDLYEAMSITETSPSENWDYDTMNNTAMMDYISNFCGINVYTPEFSRTLTMWFVNNFINRTSDFLSLSVWLNIKTSIASSIVDVYRYI